MKEKSLLTNKKFTLILSLVGVYLLTAGISWAAFSFVRGGDSGNASETVSEGRSKIDPNLPKTEECPINGKMYSKPEREIWEQRRPITAIIENHLDSRPQSGLSYGDVVYEAVAEGGITRFLSVFYCGSSAQEVRISPVRSVRVYFVNFAAEYGANPIFVHTGGANNICNNCPGGVKPRSDVSPEVDAFKLLGKMGWRGPKANAMDAGTNVGAPVFIRDQYRLGPKAAWEHSVVGFTDKIFEEAKERGYAKEDSEGVAWDKSFVPWLFKDDAPSSSPAASEISFEFWSNKPDYDVSWKYSADGNRYLRSNGGKEHTDFETKNQISTKNLVIQFVKENGPVDNEGHMFYTTVGKGEALIFQNGDVIEATWEKKSPTDRTKFTDSSKKEISFVRGEIWIEAVPTGNDIKY